MFTTVDVKSGYWQIKLNQYSKELTIFITPFGWFFFNRFPMGVKCAQDEFWRAMLENFGNTKNVLLVSGDTIVYAFEEDDSNHDTMLNKLPETARKINCMFNPEDTDNRYTFLQPHNIKRWNKTRPQESQSDHPHEPP